jgi:methylmalonyl-CoA mutase
MTQFLQEAGPQSAVSAVAARRAKCLDTRRDVLVGTNMYPNMKEVPLRASFVDYKALAGTRSAQLQAHRLGTDLFLFHHRLGEFCIEFGNRSQEIIEKGKEAVLAGATLGDLWAVLDNAEDQKLSVQPLRIHRASERFEILRGRAEEILAERGSRPKAFLASVGSLSSFKPRADFSRAFFEVGGFEVLGDSAYENEEDAVRAFLASGVRIAAICAADQAYPELVPKLTGALKGSVPGTMVLVAGKPGPEQEKVYREAGVDDFFFVGVNCHDLLTALQERS